MVPQDVFRTTPRGEDRKNGKKRGEEKRVLPTFLWVGNSAGCGPMRATTVLDTELDTLPKK
jgi:hypothetical protein